MACRFTAFLILVTFGAALSAATVDVDLQSSPDGSTWSSAVAGLVAVDSSPLYYRATVTPTGGAESVSNTILVDRVSAGSQAHVLLEVSDELSRWDSAIKGNYDITASKKFFRVQEDVFQELVSVTGGTIQLEGFPITVEDFEIGRFEVNQELWDEVYAWALLNGYSFSNNAGGNWLDPGCLTPGHPIHSVNWYDVVKWCNARTEMEGGLTPVYYTDGTNTTVYRTGEIIPGNVGVLLTADGYRLPTLSEWYFAALGGLSSNGYLYSGSDTLDDVGRYVVNSIDAECPENAPGDTNGTWPCGSLLPNELGLFDMSGNVTEWGETGSTGSRHSLGGDFNDDPGGLVNELALSLSSIGTSLADLNLYEFGFRVARGVRTPPASAIAPETTSKARKGGKKADFSRSGGSSKKAQ